MSIDKSVLEAKVRDSAGKGVSRRLRREGLVPAVVYGKHMEKPLHIAVNPKATRQALNTPHKFNTLITLKLDGGEQQVLFKDYQQDPVSREILHVDFLSVRENELVKVKVPLVLTGKAEGVAAGGLLTQARRELEVFAKPNAIPVQIDVDVTSMKIAQALHINDVKMPEGITVKTTVNYTLAVLSAPEGAAEETPAAAAAAPAAAKAPAGGKAPAAAAAPAKGGAKK